MIEALDGDYENSALFSDAEKAAIHWAVIMTEKLYQGAPGKPPQHRAALEVLKKYYSTAQIIELTHAIGYTNYWNRFTDILEVDLEDQESVDKGSLVGSRTQDPSERRQPRKVPRSKRKRG